MRTFVTFKCEDPKLWLEDYTVNGMLELEYFSGMVNCAKSASTEAIMSCISEEQMPAFKQYVLEMAMLENDSQIMSLDGSPPVFGLKEVRKLAAWFQENELKS